MFFNVMDDGCLVFSVVLDVISRCIVFNTYGR